MDPVMIENGLRAIVTLAFAYVAVVGGASALKFAILDQEVRILIKQQQQFLDDLGGGFRVKMDERRRRREQLLADRAAAFDQTSAESKILKIAERAKVARAEKEAHEALLAST